MKRTAIALLLDLLLVSSAFAAFGIFQLGNTASFLLINSVDFLLINSGGDKLILR